MVKLVIFGSGGFASEILWAVERSNQQSAIFDVVGFCDDGEYADDQVHGYPFLGNLEFACRRIGTSNVSFHVAIGSNAARQKVAARCQAVGWQPATVVDPSVLVASSAEVGAGVYLGAGTIVCPNVKIGDFALINLHCSLGHDSMIGAYSQLCPGARVSGFGKLGEGAFMGTNALIGPGVSLGDWSVLGAGSAGLKDVPNTEKHGGVPAKKLNSRSH